MRRLVRLAALVLAAAPVCAQSPATNLTPVRAQAVPASRAVVAVAGDDARSLAPRLENLTVGVRADTAQPAPPKPRKFGDTKQNRALMIVGSAGLLAGLVIGGDAGALIAIAGALVGLYGLYKYLE